MYYFKTTLMLPLCTYSN